MYTLAGAMYYFMVYLAGLVLLGIIVSYEPLRFYIKIQLLAISAILAVTIQFPFMFLRIGDWRNAMLPLWVIHKVMQFVGVTFEIRGKENIIKDSGKVIVTNHQSLLDLAFAAELWLLFERCTVLVKKEMRYYGPFGLGCWLAGIIFIDRQKSKESQDMLKAVVKPVQERKATVIVAVEGRRNRTTTLLPFKKGAFHLAIDAQLPVQPIVMSKYHFFSSKKKIFNSGKSYLTILPPISTKGMTKEDLPKLIADAYKVMNDCYLETSQETISEHINAFEDGK